MDAAVGGSQRLSSPLHYPSFWEEIDDLGRDIDLMHLGSPSEDRGVPPFSTSPGTVDAGAASFQDLSSQFNFSEETNDFFDGTNDSLEETTDKDIGGASSGPRPSRSREEFRVLYPLDRIVKL